MFILVLIETLWNVKCLPVRYQLQPGQVLIETLWNVKSGRFPQRTFCTGRINRNIMECKAKKDRKYGKA